MMITTDYLNIFMMISFAGLLLLFLNNNNFLGGNKE